MMAGIVFSAVMLRTSSPSALADAAKSKNRDQLRPFDHAPGPMTPPEASDGAGNDSPGGQGAPAFGGGFADINRDGAVDLVDYAEFDRCRSQAAGGTISMICRVFDVDANIRLDLRDWQAFQSIFTGPSPAGHSISGCVLDSVDGENRVGVEGVVMSFSGGLLTAKVATDRYGVYSMNVPNGWTGTVCARDRQMSFDPPMAEYADVVSNQVQNFTARHDDLLIVGSVVRGDDITPATGRPITLVFRDDHGALLRTIVTQNGRYQATLPAGADGIRRTGTITAVGPDVRFEKPAQTFAVSRTSSTGPTFVAFYDFYVDGGR